MQADSSSIRMKTPMRPTESMNSVAASTIGSTMKSVTEASWIWRGASGCGAQQTRRPMARILYVHSRRNTFTRIDRDALEERHEVVDYLQEGFKPRPVELWRKVGECDAVVGWFASWHTALALRFARMRAQALAPHLRRLRHGRDARDRLRLPARRGAAAAGALDRQPRDAPRHQLRVVASRDRRERRASIPERVEVVYHGIPDRFADVDPAAPRERMALTVGAVYDVNLLRKGHGPFCEAAAASCPTSSGSWPARGGTTRAQSSRRRRPRT